jgi:LssY-like putative type I secretion system component LssY
MKKCSCLSVSLLTFFLLSLSHPGFGQSAAGPRDLSYTISTSQTWTDTGTDLQAGDLLEISAAPATPGNGVPDRHQIAGSTCDPNGIASAAKSGSLPVADANSGALIARLQPQGNAIEVGASKQVRVDAPGHLFLGVNTAGTAPCAGSIAVKVHITSGESSPAPVAAAAPDVAKNANPANPPANNGTATQSGAPTNESAADVKKKLAAAAQVWLQGQFGTGTEKAGASTSSNSAVNGSGATTSASTLDVSKDKLDSTLAKAIDGLPRRVNDEFDHLGDMVNFVIVGSQKDMQDSLDAANWHVADTNNTESALKAVLQTYEKKDYLTMPMSPLRLFGRVQDYGYEQAEPYSVVASRHHFRIWKAPFTYNGQTVWVGAGTHDIGFEKDQRNGKVTHKIDPNVDAERENIAASLQKAAKVKSLHYYLPPNPVQDARNATGGGYRSDGRIIVIVLK